MMLKSVFGKVNFFTRFSSSSAVKEELKKTVLHDAHVELQATIVPFAGYSMPVLYKGESLVQSVNHVRTEAGLFDVSHMGQLRFFGKDRATFLESLTTSDVKSMKSGSTKYTLLTNEQGGVVDDSVFTTFDDHIYMVINAGCFKKDVQHLSKHLAVAKAKGLDVDMKVHDDLSLIALQGPKAAAVLQNVVDVDLSKMKFMSSTPGHFLAAPEEVLITRCGYTGEDGFEISMPSSRAVQLWKLLLSDKRVHPAGLGARDSLRLEAGLCLYGNDLNENITPVEADLLFAINKRRRSEGGFLGDSVILKQIKEGTKTIRTALFTEGAPARAGSTVFDASGETPVGSISSGSPSPTLKRNIAMAYMDSAFSKVGTKLFVEVRGNKYPAEVTTLPFVKKGWK